MKNNLIFSALFLYCFLSGSPSLGQNIIYKHPACNSETSLIRYYKDDVDIRVEQWVLDPSGNPAQSCSYVDRSTGLAYTFYFPSYCIVSDFEILKGNVYFCGGDLPSAYWGYFNIDSVFFFGGDVHYVSVPTSETPYVNGLRFLDVFEESGSIHIVMTGNGYTSNGMVSVVAEAWYNTFGWTFWFAIDNSHTLFLRDITLTDDYVVIVGSYNGKHTILHYDRPSGANVYYSMFSLLGGTPGSSVNAPLHITDASIFTPYNIYTNMLARHTSNNGFITVCNSSSNSYVVSYYSTPVVDPYERFSFTDDISGLLDMAYNEYVNSLCLTKCMNTIYRIRPYAANIEKVNTDLFHWTSIDDIPKSKYFTLSGSTWDLSAAMHWIYDVSNHNNCISIVELPINNILRKQDTINLPQEIINRDFSWRSYHTTIYPSEIEIICR